MCGCRTCAQFGVPFWPLCSFHHALGLTRLQVPRTSVTCIWMITGLKKNVSTLFWSSSANKVPSSPPLKAPFLICAACSHESQSNISLLFSTPTLSPPSMVEGLRRMLTLIFMHSWLLYYYFFPLGCLVLIMPFAH